MQPLKKEHLSVALFISGALLLLLAINYMQYSGSFTMSETVLCSLIGGAAMISAVILIMHGEFVDSYLWLEARKTWKVNNALLVAAAFLLSALFSGLFVRSAGDFMVFYLISIIIISGLAVFQYKKAIAEIISIKQKRK